jgi:hypothetical protein
MMALFADIGMPADEASATTTFCRSGFLKRLELWVRDSD